MSGVASPPRLDAKASWARTRSIWARSSSSTGPSRATVIRVRVVSKAPAWTLAKAADRGGGGQAGPGLSSAGRLLQLGCHLLIGAGRGAGTVPGPPVRVGFGVGG